MSAAIPQVVWDSTRHPCSPPWQLRPLRFRFLHRAAVWAGSSSRRRRDV